MRIVVDFDNTICNSTETILNIYKKMKNKDFSFSVENVAWNFEPYVEKKDFEEVLKLFNQKVFYENVKFLPKAKESLRELSKKHELVICSKCEGAEGLYLKRGWINKNLPFIKQENILLLQQKNFDKSRIEGDIIIDDYVPCLVGNYDRQAVLKFGRYRYNRLFNVDDELLEEMQELVNHGVGAFPVDNWSEVLHVVELLEEMKTEEFIKN